MDANIRARIRHAAVSTYSEGSDEQPQLNLRGEQIVANGLPANAQLVSMGNSWVASTTTAAAPVIAIPTTAALIALWNGEFGGGKSYVIDSVFAYVVVATAAVQAMGILANVAVQPVVTAIANTITPKPLRSGRPYNGQGRVAVGVTLDATNGVAANWFPLGTSSAPVNTTQVGQVLDVPVNGSIILPPGGQLALTVLSGAATASSIHVGVRWHELVLPSVV